MSEENNEVVENVEESVVENTTEESSEAQGESVDDLKSLLGEDAEVDSSEEDDTEDLLARLEPKEDSEEEASTEDEDETEEDVQKDDSEEDSKEDSAEEESEEASEKDEAKLEVKINGKVEEMTLSQIKEEHPEVLDQIKAGVSGQKEIQRRFTELDKERKEFYTEKQAVEQYIREFGEQVKDGNILGGLQYFAEFAGLPPYVVKEQLVAAVRPEIEKRSMMSQEEINNQRLKEENEYLAKKNESDQQRWAREQAELAQQQAHAELQSQIESIRETHNINEEEWENALDELDQTVPPDQPITKEMVRDHVLSQKAEAETNSKIETAMSSHSEKLEEIGADGLEEELRKVIQAYPDLTEEEISGIVGEAIKIREKELIEKSLEKKAKKTAKPVKSKEKTQVDQLKALLEEDF